MSNKWIRHKIVREYAGVNLLSSEETIRTISKLKDQFALAEQYLIFNSKKREEIKQVLINKEYNYISLGYDCLPRTVATRWGIKKTKKEGELSLPFDLAVNHIFSVVNLLKEDFNGFMDPKRLGVNENNKIYHKKFKTVFNHEIDEKFIKDSFSLLCEMYNKRVKNFKNLRNCSIPNVLVHALSPNCDRNNIISLTETVSNYFLNKNIIIILNTWEENTVDKTIIEKCSGQVFYHHEQYPEGRTWYDPLFFSSTEGQKFETNIVEFICDIIRNKI
jgi:hypothetical protein